MSGAGCDKTTAAAMYAQKNHEVFVILCDGDTRRGDLIWEIVRRLGFKTYGVRICEISDLVIESIVQTENPFLVFDEGDKLNDNVFRCFINLYNRLGGKCGITFLSTDYIQHRIDCNLNHNRKGYNETHSRIGHKFFELEPTSCNNMFAIRQANGLTDKKQTIKVIDLTGKSEFGLRCVRDAIRRERKVAATK